MSVPFKSIAIYQETRDEAYYSAFECDILHRIFNEGIIYRVFAAMTKNYNHIQCIRGGRQLFLLCRKGLYKHKQKILTLFPEYPKPLNINPALISLKSLYTFGLALGSIIVFLYLFFVGENDQR